MMIVVYVSLWFVIYLYKIFYTFHMTDSNVGISFVSIMFLSIKFSNKSIMDTLYSTFSLIFLLRIRDFIFKVCIIRRVCKLNAF